MSKEKRLELMLFMVVRNTVVLPKGIELGKSLKEISDMTKETIREIERQIDFEVAEKQYNL